MDTTVTSELISRDGSDWVRIEAVRSNGDMRGVDVKMPASFEELDGACKVLMSALAGCAETELFLSGARAAGIIPE